MTATWRFQEKSAAEKTRDAVQGEFFATEALKTASDALVREGIQNTLDARTTLEHKAKVRIHVSGREGAIPAERIAPYINDAWPHLAAQGNGLNDPPTRTESCAYLIFEDFGTRGLTGDITQHCEHEGDENPFYYFFRAEGRSSKSGESLGRWGIGKVVFGMASRIKTFFGLTTRSDDGKTLLVGQSTLRSHIVDGKPYRPDGWFGYFADNGLPLPIEEASFIQRFKEDFGLHRAEEPGLSLVVPFCSDEVTAEDMITAVLSGFFLPVMRRELEVVITFPTGEITLDASTLDHEVSLRKESLPKETGALLSLSRTAMSKPQPDTVLAAPSLEGALKWSPGLLEADAAPDLRARLEDGAAIAVRFQMHVLRKYCEPTPTWFDAFIIRDDSADSSRPVFIRDGIIISDVKAPPCRGYRAIVLVEHKPLSSALGDAENPAHTEWQSKTERIKNRYKFAASHIRYVTESVRNFLQALHHSDEERDVLLLADIFPIQPEDDTTARKRRTPHSGKGKDKEPRPDPPPPKLPRYRIRKADGGFSITSGDESAVLPSALDVKVAYDVRGGNPFKHYSEYDFNLGKRPIKIASDDHFSSVEVVASNALRIGIKERGFDVTVTGFDEKRDVIIDVKPRD